MGNATEISWADSTWNPWHGCHKISQGCKNCYMFRDKKRYGQDPDVVVRSKTTFDAPLKWKEPRRIFTCSWSDWFIEEADAWREEAWDIIRRTPQHTYQILTKRADRMEGRVPNPPLPNVWLGVSVEDQQRADERIPILLRTPAAIRFLSIEPLLAPVHPKLMRCVCPRCKLPELFSDNLIGGFRAIRASRDEARASVWCQSCGWMYDDVSRIDWVIAGGESGPDARPMHPDNARHVRDLCAEQGVPFHFKQNGEWIEFRQSGLVEFPPKCETVEVQQTTQADQCSTITLCKVGKKAAGRELDGRTWDEFPSVSL